MGLPVIPHNWPLWDLRHDNTATSGLYALVRHSPLFRTQHGGNAETVIRQCPPTVLIIANGASAIPMCKRESHY